MSDPREEPSPFCTTAEAAAIVRRTPRTVLAWVRRGLLKPAGPPLPDGGYLFERAMLVAFVRGEERVRHATVDPVSIRAVVDAAHRRAMGRGERSA